MTRPMLVLDDELSLLAESAAEVLSTEAPVSRARATRDDGQVADLALWASLSELGWAGASVAESAGGLGLGLPAAAVLCEALGRRLCPVPMLSAVMVGAVDRGSLGVAVGARVALAWQEDARRPEAGRCETRAHGARVRGEKCWVLDAQHAESFVVSARVDGAVRLGLVSAQHARVTALDTFDHRDVGHVAFDDAPVRWLDGGLELLEEALTWGTVALSAELLGVACAVLDRTNDYLGQREQFGQPIGAFQALQHKAVDAFILTELARSAVWGAAFEPGPASASLAKAAASRAAVSVAKTAIQLHGGIGMTDEHDAGLFLKRAWSGAQLLGSAAWHRDRWASLHGY